MDNVGAAVTLLNWTGEPIETLQVTLNLPFRARSVESVRQGAIKFRERVRLSLPLHAADILLLKP